jgi:hypothetical protein
MSNPKSDFQFPLHAVSILCSHSVNPHRNQVLGALILAAIALVVLLLRWKFAHGQ